MNLDNETRTIEGIEFQVTRMPYKQGRKVFMRLIKALAPSIGSALREFDFGDIKKLKDLGDMPISALSGGLGALVQNLGQTLSDSDFEFISDSLAEFTEFSTERGKWLRLSNNQDLLFAGRYDLVFRWLAFAVEYNFAGFLKGWGGLSDIIQAAPTVDESRSPASSIGISTESLRASAIA